MRQALTLGLLLFIYTTELSAALVSGKWYGSFTTTMNPSETLFVLRLMSIGGKLTGTLRFCGHDCGSEQSIDVKIEDGEVTGKKVSFSVATQEPDVPNLLFRGTVNGDSFQFVVIRESPKCKSDCQIGSGSATRGRFSAPHSSATLPS